MFSWVIPSLLPLQPPLSGWSQEVDQRDEVSPACPPNSCFSSASALFH